MGKEYLIDTNAVIDYLNNKLPDPASELLDSIVAKISVITRMELLSWPGANKKQTAVLNDFIEASEVFSLEEPIILKAIEIRKETKTKLPDAIIAATAMVHQLTLITRNTKDFEKVSGLELMEPYGVE